MAKYAFSPSFSLSLSRLTPFCAQLGNQRHNHKEQKCIPSAPCCVSRRKLMQSTAALSAAFLPYMSSESAEEIAQIDFTKDRPVINFKRAFADAMEGDMKVYEGLIAERKKNLFQDQVPKASTVLDIGIGGGPNLKYLPSDARVIGLEPNKYMWMYSEEKAKKLGVSLTLQDAFAEKIPLPDASVDSVISTLTLCTVQSPSTVIDEIGRVLKPGGKFIFIEHTLAPASKPLVRMAQNVLNPLQNLAAEGCNLNRDTEGLIRNKGVVLFDEILVDRFDADFGNICSIASAFDSLIRSHISGYARRSQRDV